jgi:hypothetical protein
MSIRNKRIKCKFKYETGRWSRYWSRVGLMIYNSHSGIKSEYKFKVCSFWYSRSGSKSYSKSWK